MDQNEKTSVKPEKTTAFKCELAEIVKAVKEAEKAATKVNAEPYAASGAPDILEITLQLCEHVENLEARVESLELERMGCFVPNQIQAKVFAERQKEQDGHVATFNSDTEKSDTTQ